MKKLLILALYCLAFSGTIRAQCAGTTSCGPINGDQASLVAAFNSVNLENTTITVNAGTWHHGPNQTINVSLTHSIVLKGATTCSGPPTTNACTDSTILIDDNTHNSGGVPDSWISISVPAGKSFRWTGITAQTGTASTSNNGAFIWGGGTTQLRIDHSHFAITANVTWTIFGETYGVVDHCFIAPSNTGPRVVGGGNASWTNASGLGSTSAIYFEDNFITGATQLNDNYQGGRNVYRFNTINNMSGQTHPLGHDGNNGNDRGGRLTEMYQNKFTAPSCSGSGGTCKFNIMFHSAGTGAYWGNNNPFISSSAGGGWNFFLTTHSMRSNNGTYTQVPTPGGWGYCGTQFNGTGSNWDENTSSTTGYHCIDDPGRGAGDLLTGTHNGNWPANFTYTSSNSSIGQLITDSNNHNERLNSFGTTGSSPPVWSTSGGTVTDGTVSWTDQGLAKVNSARGNIIAYPRQASEPIYAGWLETFNPSSAAGATYYLDQSSGRVVRNTDIFLFGDCASGGGTQSGGVCVGTLASRQTNCSAGVAYWATDQGSWNSSGGNNINSYSGQGVLYQCNPANTWTAYYTPLTYPHPLIPGGGTATLQVTCPSTCTSFAFANTVVGNNLNSSTFTLTNTGTATLTLSGTNWLSDLVNYQIVSNACGAPIAPGGTCTFFVNFRPQSAASFPATLTFVSNATNSPTVVNLSGTGIPPQASTPTYSPTPGTYPNSIAVTISSTSASAVICYTTSALPAPATDGASGCTTGTLFSGSIPVSGTTNFFAVAGGTGYTDSAVGAGTYLTLATGGGRSVFAGNIIMKGSVTK